jgi:hypothetical protein
VFLVKKIEGEQPPRKPDMVQVSVSKGLGVDRGFGTFYTLTIAEARELRDALNEQLGQDAPDNSLAIRHLIACARNWSHAYANGGNYFSDHGHDSRAHYAMLARVDLRRAIEAIPE